MTRRCFHLGFVLAICVQVHTTSGQYVYYNESVFGGGFRLHRSALDGSSHQLLLQRSELPVAFAVDPITRKLYWAEWTSIYVADEDGANSQVFMPGVACNSLAIDPYARVLYYTNGGDPTQLRRVNLNGHNDQLMIQFPSGSFIDIELHLPSGKIYWTLYTGSTYMTVRANLDGTQQETLSPPIWTDQLDIDPIDSLLYSVRAFQNQIDRMDLDAQNAQTLATGTDPKDVAVDVPGGKIYWVEYQPSRVMRMNMDGSGVEVFRANINAAENIFVLSVTDCNDNGIDDWCDIDCGPSGGYCDVPGCGTFTDIDQNQRLDVCDECDGNGLPDECDLSCDASGGLCDVPGCGMGDDCNDNDILDACDLLSGTSDDCNTNSVLDECDTASATSPDCNLNSVPDECEPLGEDCNNNGIRDDCDTLTGPSEDCNLNLIPDECETLNVDCNNNGIRDDCDIATGPSEDCNLNGVPDECDPAAPDCNANGIPDDCDLITGPSNDCNANQIPDECDNGPLPSKIYWGDSTGRIMRSDMNGGFVEEVLATATLPQAMTIDPLRRKIYWSDANDASVHRANLDGTGAEIVLTAIDSFHQRDGLAIDPFDYLLYYTQIYDGEFGRNGSLNFVFLPETNPQNISASFSRLTRDVALHLPSKSVFWLRELTSPPNCTLHRADIVPYPYDNDIDQISVASSLTMTIDATRDEIYTGTATAIRRYSYLGGAVLATIVPGNTPTSMANDPFDGDGFVYWTSSGSGEIKRANRSGTVIQTLHSGLPQPGPIAVVRAVDCNENGVEDICEISCGTPCGPCDVPGCGTGIDCDRDGLLDVCEPSQDCNANGTDDRCDIASGTSTDCNLSLTPDECDGNDCNGNGKPDTCDLSAETSEDCNDNLVPDECDLASGTENDCNTNQVPDTCESECNNNNVPDSCDIASGFSEDCNLNGRPDECDLANNDCNANGIPDICDVTSETSTDCDGNNQPDECAVDGHDCNDNGIHDACDILSGFSEDENGDGWPDECIFVPPDDPTADPTGLSKCRFISFRPSSTPEHTALRVRMVSLHEVVPPYNGTLTIPFDLFEGQYVWVGPPATFVESNSTQIQFRSSSTQCTPHYRDWSTVGLLHVTGAHILPSSIYQVQHVSIGCQGQEPDCPFVSAPLEIRTTRWGDIEIPFNPPSNTTQPDVGDISASVNKFRSALGAPIKARSFVTGTDTFGNINLSPDLGFSHIAAVVDAFRGSGYPFKPGKCAGSNAACASHADCGANGPCNLYCPN